MRTSILFSLVSFLVINCLAPKAQTFDFIASAIPSGEQNELHKNESFIELPSKRTEYSMSFISDRGTTRSVYSKAPLCYKKNKRWELIDLTPVYNENTWISAKQARPVHIDEKGNVRIELGVNQCMELLHSTSFNGQSFPFSMPFWNGHSLISEGSMIKKKTEFIQGGIKYSYILDSVFFEGNLEIIEYLVLPPGFDLKLNEDVSRLEITDEKGKIIALFDQVLCFDQDYNTHQGVYSVEKHQGVFKVKITLDKTWIQGERSFPIIIDPVVAGVPSTWNGGNMPSCFMPQYNSDSLLVTIPAGITLTGLFVSSSFYADPFTPATMGMGSMNFSTDCASSQYFTITGALENSPGTAYLDSFNLLNPLSCCFPKSCSDTSIYVKFNLGRDALGSGCNVTYIRYDQFTQYPFKVVIYGKTPETYGNEWYVPQDPICSNQCEFQATGYARYGVPPYTFTHPWSQDTVVAGTNIGCNVGSTNNQFTLVNPNCPIYCDSLLTALEVPPPVITDACGVTIEDIPIKTKPILPAALPTVFYDSTVCDGQLLEVDLDACISGANVNYFGNGYSGADQISHVLGLSGDTVAQLEYFSYATLNGCISDTVSIPVFVIPNPSSGYSSSLNPGVIETTVSFNNISESPLGPITSSSWYIDGNLTGQESNLENIFALPGQYEMCLIVEDLFACRDTACSLFLVVPAEIENINVITPNGDGINDYLEFNYLEFYNSTSLHVYNRWGNLVYSAENYQNNWGGEELSDGVYFYLLKVDDTDTSYSSFFQLIK